MAAEHLTLCSLRRRKHKKFAKQLAQHLREDRLLSIQPAALMAALSSDHPVSGSSLASRLGVTRAAVWKQIEALRELGAPIEAAAGRGYRLAWPIEPLDAAAIRADVEAPVRKRLGAIDVHWQIESTSSALMSRADDATDLSVCLAEAQSGGRGRRGRTWHSPLAGNVYFSLLRRFRRGMGSLTGLSLIGGVAVVEALRDCGVEAGLKWPNDVLAGEGKLAGILVELGGEFLGPCFAVVGIGINVRAPIGAHRIDQPHVDLATLCAGNPPSRNHLIGRLLSRLVPALDRFEDVGFAAFRAEYARYDRLAGHAVTVRTADGMREGISEGVDARGALRVREGGNVAVYDSADVTVRGA